MGILMPLSYSFIGVQLFGKSVEVEDIKEKR